MNSPEPMTREELLELAALDAVGLLDPYESALYTRSFHHAPAAVQEEIRIIQAELVSNPDLLPDAEPPADLRERVLAHVAATIDREAMAHHPLATIGRPQLQPRTVAGRIGFGGPAGIWRAASFALVAAVAILSYFLAEAARHNHEITRLALSNGTSEELETKIGPTINQFLYDADAEFVRFVPANGVPVAGRGLFALVNRENGTAFMVMRGLPATADGQWYTLAVTDSTGDRHELRAFESDGGLVAVNLELPALATGALNFELIGPGGHIVYTT